MIRDTKSSYMAKVQGNTLAYNQVFNLASPHTKVVLKDLALFCRAHVTTFHPDPRVHAVLEGRREVWLKIQEMLELTPEQIYELHKIKEFRDGNTTNTSSAV